MKKTVQVQELFDAEGGVEYILCHADNTPVDQTRKLFSPKYLYDRKMLTGRAEAGRGNAHFFIVDGCEFVLRHYCRGGLVARFNKDRYRWKDLETTRAYCEFELLVKMIEMDLPVPTPYAARVCRSGGKYSADLITERIPSAQSLTELCGKKSAGERLWFSVGSTIRRFHDQQIYHADLNAHNILISKKVVYLIDFDKCKIKLNSNRWKKSNIERLKRSLDKLENRGVINFQEDDWKVFLDGYQSDN